MIEEIFLFLNISPLTALHWILALSITLFIIDIFCQTEVISWVSLLVFATYFTLFLDIIVNIPLQWSPLAFFGMLILEFVFYYAIWIQIARPFINKFILGKASKERNERAKGTVTQLRIIDNKYFVNFEGELCSAILADSDLTAKDQDQVIIIGEINNRFVVELIF